MEEILIVLLCLFLNALFAAYEMAFVSVSKSELRALSRKGDLRARRLIQLRESPERTLSIIQVGITLVGALAAAVGGAGAAETLEPSLMGLFGLRELYAEILSVLIVVVPLTYLSVVIGELVPKSLALRNPKRIVLMGAEALFISDRLLSPIVTLLESSTKFLLKYFFSKSKHDEQHTPITIEIDSFSPLHQRFMLNMANIEKIKVQDIQVPWSEVVAIESSSSMEQVKAIVLTSGHTRLPVVEGEKVLGILHTKEFLAWSETGEREWKDITRTALKVGPNLLALRLLRQMQEKRSHLSVLEDSNSKPLGIVTLEDILEEVVGDIFDEDDDGKIRKIFAARARSRTTSQMRKG